MLNQPPALLLLLLPVLLLVIRRDLLLSLQEAVGPHLRAASKPGAHISILRYGHQQESYES
jgi:hypothetical protein